SAWPIMCVCGRCRVRSCGHTRTAHGVARMSVRLPARLVAVITSIAALLAVFAVPGAADEGEVRLLVTYETPLAGATVASVSGDAVDDALGDPVDDISSVEVLEFRGRADAEAARRRLAARDDVVAVE